MNIHTFIAWCKIEKGSLKSTPAPIHMYKTFRYTEYCCTLHTFMCILLRYIRPWRWGFPFWHHQHFQLENEFLFTSNCIHSIYIFLSSKSIRFTFWKKKSSFSFGLIRAMISLPDTSLCWYHSPFWRVNSFDDCSNNKKRTPVNVMQAIEQLCNIFSWISIKKGEAWQVLIFAPFSSYHIIILISMGEEWAMNFHEK